MIEPIGAEREARYTGGPSTMTIELPLSGEMFEAELVQDEHGVL
jgi:hypothetical protein